MLTVGSLFSGIGGLDLGLERAGMKVLWQVEKDQACQQVLKRHWPKVALHDDVRAVSASTLEAVDLICGGFPCQPVSVSGRRQGTRDPRWLWPEFARLVGELRPRYLLLENVPALLNQGGAEVFADIAEMGYHASWGVLPAGAFGAPHLRERLFLVADSTGPAPLLADPAGGPLGEDPIPLQPEGISPRDWTLDAEGRLAGRVHARWAKVVRYPAPDIWVSGVGDGTARRVDRERMIGNSVVPQVAEWVGRRVVEHHGADVAREEVHEHRVDDRAFRCDAIDCIDDIYCASCGHLLWVVI